MSSKDEAARILDEGLPAEVPGWDLTDDFLEDVGRFLDTSLHDPVPDNGVGAVSQAPAYSSADQTGLIETQLDNNLSPPVPADLASDLSHTQRRLHSNRLAQARARQRKKVGSCCWESVEVEAQICNVAAAMHLYSVSSRPGQTACSHNLQKQQRSSEL